MPTWSNSALPEALMCLISDFAAMTTAHERPPSLWGSRE